MLFPGITVYNDVVNITTTSLQVPYQLIYKLLEGSRGIFHAKRHDFVLVQSFQCNKCRDPFCTFCKWSCQYPFSKSNLLTNLAGPILSMQSLIRGMGYEFVFVTVFNFLKSVQKQ